jgi:hypothetical protein
LAVAATGVAGFLAGVTTFLAEVVCAIRAEVVVNAKKAITIFFMIVV